MHLLTQLEVGCCRSSQMTEPDLYLTGCPGHMAHNAAHKGVSGFDGEHLVDDPSCLDT